MGAPSGGRAQWCSLPPAPPLPPRRRPAAAAAAAAAATAGRSRADKAALVRRSGRAAAAPTETCSRPDRDVQLHGGLSVLSAAAAARWWVGPRTVVGGATDARLGSRGAGLRVAAACDHDASPKGHVSVGWARGWGRRGRAVPRPCSHCRYPHRAHTHGSAALTACLALSLSLTPHPHQARRQQEGVRAPDHRLRCARRRQQDWHHLSMRSA